MTYFDIGLAAFFIVVIAGICMGCGNNRSIIIYKNWDDLGLCFLIPASFILIHMTFSSLGGNPAVGMAIGGCVAGALFILMVVNSFADNGRNIFKTMLAVTVKVPLGLLWIFNLLQLLNPDGNTGRQRRQSRGQALIFLTLLTPIIGLLVADKSGNYFNPRNWLKGRRNVGSIRNHL